MRLLCKMRIRMRDNHLFIFEMDFADTLRCIPMVVRMKLDLCGVKLSLRQWSHFTVAERNGLIKHPVESLNERAAYRARLLQLIRMQAGEEPKFLPVVNSGVWQKSDTVPDIILETARLFGEQEPTPDQWCSLSPLQRFALIKLTRPGHDNLNFVPAMREFFNTGLRQ
ncbi:nitrate reductase associated protein [Acetobacter aceti]|nr:nitrate reductase associated protein [Acetobacter aceti]